jgi:hypothetical protein
MGLPWARRLCVGFHAALIVVIVGLALWRWISDPAHDFKQLLIGIAATGLQLGCLQLWRRDEIVAWFAARNDRDEHRDHRREA